MLFRRVGRKDVSGSKVKPQRLRYQLSVYRETRTTEDQVAASDAQRDGVAVITAGAVVGRLRGSVQSVCVDEPDPHDLPCGAAHALIALVAAGVDGVDHLEVSALTADLADAFVVRRQPSR